MKVKITLDLPVELEEKQVRNPHLTTNDLRLNFDQQQRHKYVLRGR